MAATTTPRHHHVADDEEDDDIPNGDTSRDLRTHVSIINPYQAMRREVSRKTSLKHALGPFFDLLKRPDG